MTKLENIIKITGIIEIKSGLHIGGSDGGIKIGGIDNEVIKNPVKNYPIIPGSSLKGKIRSLLEWRCGHTGDKPLSPNDIEQPTDTSEQSTDTSEQSTDISEQSTDTSEQSTDTSEQSTDKNEQPKLDKQLAENILRLFGSSAAAKKSDYGVARLSFYDCDLCDEWVDNNKSNNSLTTSLTEEKTENVINRISGTAEHPRNMERVPANAEFDFNVTMRLFDTDKNDEEKLLNTLLEGMKLLTYDSLGGSGSRGYGKIEFLGLKKQFLGLEKQDNESIDFDKIDPFAKKQKKQKK